MNLISKRTAASPMTALGAILVVTVLLAVAGYYVGTSIRTTATVTVGGPAVATVTTTSVATDVATIVGTSVTTVTRSSTATVTSTAVVTTVMTYGVPDTDNDGD